MKVFVSYRRADAQHLAWMIRERLPAQDPSASVFVDVASIPPGSEFPVTIRNEIDKSEVVLALVGPAWQPERLHDPDDFVRQELEFALERRKRVVPILHGDAAMPGLEVLPAELAWFAARNAIRFGDAFQIETDLATLVERIRQPTPALGTLHAAIWRHYEQGDTPALEQAVHELWTEWQDEPTPAAAESYRTLAVVLVRDKRLVERNVWLSRAITAAHLSGARNALAAALLPFFFQNLEAGDGDRARDVLKEIARLLDDKDATQVPSGGMVRRLYHEKLAYSYLADGSFELAGTAYAEAAQLAGDDERGKQKAEASGAWCRYRLGDTDEAIETTERIASAAAERGWTDLAATARDNAAEMRRGGVSLSPYEVT